MLLDDDELREIEDALVTAALQPETWSAAVAQIVARCGARGAAVLPLRGRVPGVPISPSCENLMESYFKGGWSERDHRVNGLPKLVQTGILVDQDISTPEFIRVSPYYTEFLNRLGFQWFAGLHVAVGDDAWCLTLQRTREQGLFTPDEQVALHRMIAPLTRAARFAQMIGEARFQGITDTLEALRIAGVLLDRTGRAIHINERAEQLLSQDLDLTQGYLRVPGDRRATEAIRAHIEAAIWSDLRPNDPALAPVTIQQAGRPTLIVSAQPLRRAGLEYLHSARAIVTVKDLSGASPLASGLLRAAYGLTEREVSLCEALLAGHSVIETADALGITVNTARTHLKRIMAKTETNRQSELLMLLGRYQRG